jgi:hypothetical protein
MVDREIHSELEVQETSQETTETIPNLSLEEYLQSSLANSPTLSRLKSKTLALKNELYDILLVIIQ